MIHTGEMCKFVKFFSTNKFTLMKLNLYKLLLYIGLLILPSMAAAQTSKEDFVK